MATPETIRAAGNIIESENSLSDASKSVEADLKVRKLQLSQRYLRAWRKALRLGVVPVAAEESPCSTAFFLWRKAAETLAHEQVELKHNLSAELESSRSALLAASGRYLPGYLVFATAGVRERVIGQLTGASTPVERRNKQIRADERHLLLYLQRIVGKNDSLSAFGPTGWGRSSTQDLLIDFVPSCITQREAFLERWTAHGAALAINGDSEAWLEFAPRLHPNCRLASDHVLLTDTGEVIPVEAETRELLLACDGRTPAHSLGVDFASLENLAERKLIRWEIEVPAFEPHAFDVLVSDVQNWRDGPAKTRWLERLQPIAELPRKFARTTETGERLALIEEATMRLEQLGVHKDSTRFLYSATNPIGEECFRDCGFKINQDLLNEPAREGALWIDFWRDSYAYIASRVAAGLRMLLEQAPLQDGALPLPAFVKHCAQMKLPLTGPALVTFAHLAFQEIKAGFREQLQAHSEKAEYQLTAEDCHLVRREFEYPAFDEYTYPSADLQLSAESIEAVGRGDYEWVVAELHPSPALLHHGFYWSCPDKAALSRALESVIFNQPSFQFGFYAADFTSTTAVRLFDALPELTYFVAPQRGHSSWKAIPPSETEVFIHPDHGDVCLRHYKTKQYLGSFARAWVIPLGFHPFNFSLGKNTPRLYCGKVIVQRRSWTVTLEELGSGDFTGISRDLVLAVERLRSSRHLPRHIYIRPTEEALRRSGVEGRDKDTKPVYVDLESYLFLEIFHRWLTKAGELEITEMLPDPDHLLWREADGRHTFELRTQIVPG